MIPCKDLAAASVEAQSEARAVRTLDGDDSVFFYIYDEGSSSNDTSDVEYLYYYYDSDIDDSPGKDDVVEAVLRATASVAGVKANTTKYDVLSSTQASKAVSNALAGALAGANSKAPKPLLSLPAFLQPSRLGSSNNASERGQLLTELFSNTLRNAVKNDTAGCNSTNPQDRVKCFMQNARAGQHQFENQVRSTITDMVNRANNTLGGRRTGPMLGRLQGLMNMNGTKPTQNQTTLLTALLNGNRTALDQGPIMKSLNELVKRNSSQPGDEDILTRFVNSMNPKGGRTYLCRSLKCFCSMSSFKVLHFGF